MIENFLRRLQVFSLSCLLSLAACGQDAAYRVDLDIDLEVGQHAYAGKLDEVMMSGDSSRVILGPYSVLVLFHGASSDKANIGFEVSQSGQGEWKSLTGCTDVNVPVGAGAGVGIECGDILLGAGILIEPVD